MSSSVRVSWIKRGARDRISSLDERNEGNNERKTKTTSDSRAERSKARENQPIVEIMGGGALFEASSSRTMMMTIIKKI